MCRVRTLNRAVLGMRAQYKVGAKGRTWIARTAPVKVLTDCRILNGCDSFQERRHLTWKVPQKVSASLEEEILLRVRCPPHTIEKFCQFFMLFSHAFESKFIRDISIKPDDLHVHFQQRSLSSSQFQNLDLEQMKELIFIYIYRTQLVSMQNHNLQSCRLQDQLHWWVAEARF